MLKIRIMKIVFIIPYFGKFPQWFPMFLSSLQNIKSADFLILTDDRDVYDYPLNTKVIYTSFSEIQNSFKVKLGAKICLKSPYKLCDYKPVYGEVFQFFIKDYAYWGYCDLDLIFGDFDGFLRKHRFFEEEYDRFSKAGHLTIYKNNSKINSLYKSKIKNYNSFFGFDFAIKTTFPVHFDEVGMNILCYQNNLKYFDEILYGNSSPEFEVITINYKKKPEILHKNNGKLWVSYLNIDGTVESIEMMYLHIMRRPVIPICVESDADYIITNTGFHPYKIEKINEYFSDYSSKSVESQNKHFESFKKSMRKKTFELILRECKAFPFTCFLNIFKRFYGVRLLRKIKY